MPPPIPVELHPHSPNWAQAAKIEAARITRELGQSIVVVHHIGSTAIAGIHAKPILDMMPEVRRIAALDDLRPAFESLGYRCWGEYGLAGRRYYTFDDAATGVRQYQLHCFEVGHPQIEQHLAFRDYLRAHPAKATEYNSEKQRCRELHPNDSHAYTQAKAAWIEAHLPVALAYRRS
ncbi:MAG: GrpB family protein [Planctomycetaceae bacterium]